MKTELSCVLALIVACPAVAEVRFEPRDMPLHVYDGDWTHFVGGGVAAFDCNGDDLPDLFAAGGSNLAQLMINTTDAPGAPLSYRASTPKELALTGVIGAYPLDIDRDGHMDLAVLRDGPDLLMQGKGNCRFAPFEGLGFASGSHWTTAFSATWETGQTLPTLAFGSYVDRDDPKGPFGTCDATLLYRPDGNKYAPEVRLEPGFCALSMLFTDWGRNGRADLRISNDRHYYVRGGQEQLWAMEDSPRPYEEQEGWLPYHLWGMGIAARDITGDGLADVYLTSMGDQKLQFFDPATGGPTYRDATYDRGTTAHRPHLGDDGRPSTGWHAAFGDVDNDGLDDIFVAKGNVEQMPDAAMTDPNTLLLQAADGMFHEVAATAGVASMHRGRGAVLMDLNLDGRLDLAVVNRRAPMELYENVTGGTNHWLLVQVTALEGAHVELRTKDGRVQTREITVGGGHAGGQSGQLHFGLGTERSAQIRVLLPDQEPGAWQNVAANSILHLGVIP